MKYPKVTGPLMKRIIAIFLLLVMCSAVSADRWRRIEYKGKTYILYERNLRPRRRKTPTVYKIPGTNRYTSDTRQLMYPYRGRR